MTLDTLLEAFEYHIYLGLPVADRAAALAEMQARLTIWQTHTTMELVELLADSDVANLLGVRLADFDADNAVTGA
jgi:hypothetical protein